MMGNRIIEVTPEQANKLYALVGRCDNEDDDMRDIRGQLDNIVADVGYVRYQVAACPHFSIVDCSDAAQDETEGTDNE